MSTAQRRRAAQRAHAERLPRAEGQAEGRLQRNRDHQTARSAPGRHPLLPPARRVREGGYPAHRCPGHRRAGNGQQAVPGGARGRRRRAAQRADPLRGFAVARNHLSAVLPRHHPLRGADGSARHRARAALAIHGARFGVVATPEVGARVPVRDRVRSYRRRRSDGRLRAADVS